MQRNCFFPSPTFFYLTSAARQLEDEIDLFMLFAQLRIVRDALGMIYHKDHVAISYFQIELQHSLALGTNTEAIKQGKLMIDLGICLLNDAINETPRLVEELSSNEFIYYSDTHSLVMTLNRAYFKDRMHALLHLPYSTETERELSVGIIMLAYCKAFQSARTLLDKLPDTALQLLKEAIDTLFLYAIRFADNEMVVYLLQKGVNPNINLSFKHMRIVVPFHYLLECLQASTIEVDARITEFNKRQLPGKAAELHQTYATLLLGYELIIDALLEHGADPDFVAEAPTDCRLSPRALARVELDTSLHGFCNSQSHLRDHTETLKKLVHTIIDAAPIQQQDIPAAEPATKRVKC